MPRIELTHVTKRYGQFYAVEDLSMVIEDNAFVTLLGPSGCGKTTTLRMIAGLETPTSGRITIGDEVVFDSEMGINVPANLRHVGFLFQNYALWPNMTVYQNITFGLQNVKKEMPLVDYEVATRLQLIEALNTPDKIVELVDASKNKDGVIDKKKAYLKLIDNYLISMMSAKKLYGYGVHENPSVAPKYQEQLRNEVETLKQKYVAKGYELNENCEVVDVTGEVVRKVRKLDKEEIDLAVRKVSRIVKVGIFMDRYPAELSGGQQQRVAIARTLAPEPKVLFMDEPLSNLDAKLRLEMRYELQRLHVDTGATFVYVTHDQMEAMTLATRICLINNGVLQQYDPPLTVYNKPNNTFVADFVGNPSINFVEAKGAQNGANVDVTIFDNIKASFVPSEELDLEAWYQARDQKKLEDQEHLQELLNTKGYVEKGNKDEVFKYHVQKVDEEEDTLKEDYVPVNGDFVLGVRAECIKIDPNGKIQGEIYGAMPTGMESTLKIRIGDYLITGVIFGGVIYKIGDKVNLTIDGNIKLFDRVSGKIITTGNIKL